ncbi:ribosomal protein L22 [Neolentinus lepideus HHB14362 ss-1]|uniref:Ribosomal protein L22 n=1 Tax=Neolentinus lepideus HHB14362 ss-1 TaxID=1314782 RepID=A0A165S0L1_9AGAM|nr:ribosomal protein L22 [Neolentinus lepideus HHB14362 ss-1]
MCIEKADPALAHDSLAIYATRKPSIVREYARDTANHSYETIHSATFRNPLTWLQEQLAPKIREKATEEEIEASRKEMAQRGEESVYDTIPEPVSEEGPGGAGASKKKFAEHKYSTANFKISHRKLNKLGQQIAGKPIDWAIMQMEFSEKRVSKRIKSMLVTAKHHATNYKNLDTSKLIVAESWVTKGPRSQKRIDIKGRGRFGIKVHPDSRMHVVLKEGQTWNEKAEKLRQRRLNRIASAGLVREDVPLRNPRPMWAW